jgi:hypothetical protein
MNVKLRSICFLFSFWKWGIYSSGSQRLTQLMMLQGDGFDDIVRTQESLLIVWRVSKF